MKNKHNAVISVLICLVLVVSIFTACSKKGDDSTTTLKANETWIEGVKVTYPRVQITGVELAEIVSGALGDEYKDFNDDNLGSLSKEEIDKVIDYAQNNGYIVETDEDGNVVIKKEEVPTTQLSKDELNNLYSEASIKDPNNLTPEDKENLKDAIENNDYDVVTDGNGATQVVKPNPTREAVTYTVVHTRPANNNPNGVENIHRVTITAPTQATSPMGTTIAQAKVAYPGWLKTYGNEYHHNFVNNAVGDDGSVISVGVSYSPAEDDGQAGYGAVVAKHDKSGNLKWDKILQGDKIVSFEDVAVLKDGSIIVVGYTGATKNIADDATYVCKGTLEGIIIKYGKDGTKKWTKMIGGSGDEMIYAVAATPDGGFVVGGKSNSLDGTLKGLGTEKIKAFTTKCDKDGKILWNNVLSGTKHSSVESIAVAPNGTIYTAINCITGDGEYAAITGTQTGRTTTVISKISADGKTAWNKALYGSGKTEMYGLVAENDSCIVAGYYSSTSAGNQGTFSEIRNGGNAGTVDGVVLKLTSAGDQKWITPLVGFQNDFVSDIVAIPGGYAVCGFSNSSNRDFAFLSGTSDFDSFIYTFSKYGDIKTHSSFGGTANDNARAICANGKTVYVSGMTNSGDGVFKDCSVKGSDGKGAGLVYEFKLEY